MHATSPTTPTTARPAEDPVAGWAAVAAGVLLAASVAAELVHPVQRDDGSVTDLPTFLLYLVLWTAGAAALATALYRLPGRVGRLICLTGAALLVAFGAVGASTAALTGSPAEWSFLLFAVGLLLQVIGAVPLARGLRPTLPGWWPAVLAAGAGAAVALLAEPDPWHDLGLFLFDAAWIALGLRLSLGSARGREMEPTT